MGLIKAALGSVSGILADQWKEYFYCEALPETVLLMKASKRTSAKSSNTKGSDNIISNGSVLAVADGQCAIIVEQGKVVDICAETGEYVYDNTTEPSLFTGDLSTSIKEVFKNIGKRFTFGGQPANDQRIYYVNTKELMGNKYGTPSPVPFRIVDRNINLDFEGSLRCFGEYSIRVTNPILFYTNVSGNVDSYYPREQIDGQMKTELLTALQPALARISEMGVRYSAVPAHTKELAQALNDELSADWRDKRGIEIVAFGISSMKLAEEDEAVIKELQRNAALRDPSMGAATITAATADAMKAAASNQGTGAAMAFMGMNMAQQAGGVNAQGLYQMAAQQQAAQQQYAPQPQQPAPQAAGLTCPKCGAQGLSGKFCPECGSPLAPPAPAVWTCPKCGAQGLKGKFCPECGEKNPLA